MQVQRYKKVGELDGQALVRDQNQITYKVVAGEIQSDDLWSQPLSCKLLVELQSNMPRDVRIAGMGREEFPDAFYFTFEGDNGESYEGTLCD